MFAHDQNRGLYRSETRTVHSHALSTASPHNRDARVERVTRVILNHMKGGGPGREVEEESLMKMYLSDKYQ